jgi:hypothetical protein
MVDVKIIFRINPFKQHYFAQSRSARGKKIPASPWDQKSQAGGLVCGHGGKIFILSLLTDNAIKIN